MYQKFFKRAIDAVLSALGLIVLSPVFLVIVLAIVIDDPGPVFFSQKRVGKGKTYFQLHKFRSMKMSTPHDIPTHLLENPEQYITRVGKFLRKSSLDELPQIWDIFVGKMSIIGPRPALWNQYDLIAERDKYGANDVMPGLTGWAQINGRDELEIDVKARFDGEYVRRLNFAFDCKCFFGTIASVLKHDGVVEGGTGEMHRKEEQAENEKIGFTGPVTVDFTAKKKVLITGAGSYIGESFRKYALNKYGANFEIDTLDMQDAAWREKNFSGYDAVFHVAGIAHADVGKVSEGIKQKYYAVNTQLAVETAEKAKKSGVGQFIFMSSMIVYGDSAKFGAERVITADTQPKPANFYGDSKWQADMGVRALADERFRVAVMRPPMIYGPGCKGNYPTLARLGRKMPVFPKIRNCRSMLYIDNFCEFLCQIMLLGTGGIFVPQNGEYTATSDMVSMVASACNHRIWVTKLLNPFVWLASVIPGKIGGLAAKAFGSLAYAREMSIYPGIDYQQVTLEESVRRIEAPAEETIGHAK